MGAWVAIAGILAPMLLDGWEHPVGQRPGSVCSGAQAASIGPSAPAPRWAVDPARPGPILPPVGRSAFDIVATTTGPSGPVYEVPFPFEALVARIEAYAGCAPPKTECTRQVLIPLGRSLQRTAASPDFFAYPRVVVAVDRDGTARGREDLVLKDRLYLGYQERANLIEVISYNQAAGRFEFQLVKDYRAGDKPRVVYAERGVCIACHQNHAPLFSRQQWDETNANPRIAARIAAAGAAHHGFPTRRGLDVPNAIDDSIHRANMFSVDNLLWSAGCDVNEADGARCRAAALIAAWQYRLSGGRGFAAGTDEYRAALVATLTRNAEAQWRHGLAIPNPEIPNRDPLSFPADATGLAMTHVAARLEPLQPRAPLAIWHGSDADFPKRFVTGLANRLADADVRAIDAQLARLAAANTPERRSFVSPCEVRRWESELRFRCGATQGETGMALSGRAVLDAGRVASGELASIAFPAHAPLLHFELGTARIRRDAQANTLSFAPESRGVRARLIDGRAIEGIELRWKSDGMGEATATLVDDFRPLREAIYAMAGERAGPGCVVAGPLDPARASACLLARLGTPGRRATRDDAAALPPPEADLEGSARGVVLPQVAAAFQGSCLPCHRTAESVPPNFLSGDAKRVTAALAHCAPRIFVRVGMWQVHPDARDKTPMPPAVAAQGNGDARADPGPDAATIASLRSAAAEMLRAENGTAPSLEELLARGYENLRPCLPFGS